MRGTGRLVGILLVVFGLAALLVTAAWAFSEMASANSTMTLGGAALGLALVFFLWQWFPRWVQASTCWYAVNRKTNSLPK